VGVFSCYFSVDGGGFYVDTTIQWQEKRVGAIQNGIRFDSQNHVALPNSLNDHQGGIDREMYTRQNGCSKYEDRWDS
jgi:hypothetical protein